MRSHSGKGLAGGIVVPEVIALGVVVADVGRAHAQHAGTDFGRRIDFGKQGRPRLALAAVDHVVDRRKREPVVVEMPVPHSRAAGSDCATRIDGLHALPAQGALIVGKVLGPPGGQRGQHSGGLLPRERVLAMGAPRQHGYTKGYLTISVYCQIPHGPAFLTTFWQFRRGFRRIARFLNRLLWDFPGIAGSNPGTSTILIHGFEPLLSIEVDGKSDESAGRPLPILISKTLRAGAPARKYSQGSERIEARSQQRPAAIPRRLRSLPWKRTHSRKTAFELHDTRAAGSCVDPGPVAPRNRRFGVASAAPGGIAESRAGTRTSAPPVCQ